MTGIQASELRLHVVRPTLVDLELWSKSAENLLLGTAAIESNMGHILYQNQQRAAFGIYQIEMAAHNYMWESYLISKQALAKRVISFASKRSEKVGFERDLISNLAYSTAIARLIYLQACEDLPPDDDVAGLAAVWKKYYDAEKSEKTTDEFIQCYYECKININFRW